MKAACINQFGNKDVLKITDVPRPTIKAGQVLIEVHAAGVNPFDWKVREGRTPPPAHMPAILGGDFAGVVTQVAPDVRSVSVGDTVYGQADALSGHGSYAEFTPVKATSVAPKPQHLNFITAAALPLAGISAYQALVDHANLQNGQKILIHGGAGGIGSFAIQLAKHLGAFVATTTQGQDAAFAKKLGADQVIDYETQDFTQLIKDYDAVYDLVDGDTYTRSYQVLKPGGVMVSMLSQPDEALEKQYQVRAISQFTQVTTERLASLAKLVENGAIKVQIDKIFPLQQVAEALAYIQSGQQHGKVVLHIK